MIPFAFLVRAIRSTPSACRVAALYGQTAVGVPVSYNRTAEMYNPAALRLGTHLRMMKLAKPRAQETVSAGDAWRILGPQTGGNTDVQCSSE